MHHAHEFAALAGRGFILGRLLAKLAQEFSVLIENRDAVIAIAVRNVDVAVGGIDRDIRGLY